jgi:hypothetical protein
MPNQDQQAIVSSPGTKGIRDVKQSVRTRRFSGVIPVPYSAPLEPDKFIPPALAFFHSPFSIIQFDFDIICEGEAIIPHPYTVIKRNDQSQNTPVGLSMSIFLIHDEVTITSVGYALSGGAGVKIPIQRVIGTYHYLCIDSENSLPGAGDKLLQAVAPHAVMTLANPGQGMDANLSGMFQVPIDTEQWIKLSHHTRYFIGSMQLGTNAQAGIADIDGIDEYPEPEKGYGVKSYRNVLSEMLRQGGLV